MIRVEWIQAALNEAAILWTSADSAQRKAITAAMHQIDQRLATDPGQEGESRPGGKRILFEPPLGVFFRTESSGDVVVLHVWLYRKRKPRP